MGELSLSTLKSRPDYAITLPNVLLGYLEVKAPEKGADPRRYKGHDKQQWEKLPSPPNHGWADVWMKGKFGWELSAAPFSVASITMCPAE